MREPNNIPNEYGESWDDGTYQTGATAQGKRQSGLITGLLIATIFLGGIASALGVMNVRLLQQLGQQKDPVLPVSVEGPGQPAENFLRENQNSVPKIPENGSLNLKTGNSSSVLSQKAIEDRISASVAVVSVLDGQGVELTGQALIISTDGYLLTNAHLTSNASAITVGMPGGEVLQAALVGRDDYADLAVLYVQAEGLTPAEFSADTLMMAPGYVPQGQGNLAMGSLLSRERNIPVGGDTIILYKTDLSVDHGPVFNERGQVRGFLCRPFGGEEGGWMLSASQVMNIATQLAEKGSVSGRPCLGLQVKDLSNFCRQYWKLDSGLEIAALLPEGAAQEQGLLSGDILLKLNGVAMSHRSRLFEILQSLPVGQSVTLEVFRAGQVFTVTLPVTQNP